jgi:transposase
MSLHPCRIKPVPLTTSQVAQAAFPKGNLYLTMRDEIGTLYSDWDFDTLFGGGSNEAAMKCQITIKTILCKVFGFLSCRMKNFTYFASN